tara:strand:- start:490 stop:1062 length:573 start_codon:yes stop_codon:yes gene_type:complete
MEEISIIEPSTGTLILSWVIIIIMYVGFSALAGFILWACARRIGKIKNATFMNSWGLFWILHISQIAFNLVFWFMWSLYAVGMAQSFIEETFSGSYYTPDKFSSFVVTDWLSLYPGDIFLLIFFIVLYLILSIYFAIIITKQFWNCDFKNAAFSHVLPVAIFLGLFIVYIISAIHFGFIIEIAFPEFLLS